MTVKRISSAKLPTKHGTFEIITYQDKSNPMLENVALVMGDLSNKVGPVLTRIHSRCLTGDAFGSKRCDCGQQLDLSLQKISEKGQGIIVYIDQEGRGIGLINKIRAYGLQDQGFDTVSANQHLGFEADGRDYGLAVEIFADLGVVDINLLTNNPAKVDFLRQSGITVKRVPIEIMPNKHNYHYLLTKKRKLNHQLCLPE